MKTTKMSLASIKGKLSRAEMKKIMAGSGQCLDQYSYNCSLAANPDDDLKCCPGYTCEMNASLSGTICV